MIKNSTLYKRTIRGFLGRSLGPLLKNGLPLMDNVLKPLPESVLIPLGLKAELQLLLFKRKFSDQV